MFRNCTHFVFAAAGCAGFGLAAGFCCGDVKASGDGLQGEAAVVVTVQSNVDQSDGTDRLTKLARRIATGAEESVSADRADGDASDTSIKTAVETGLKGPAGDQLRKHAAADGAPAAVAEGGDEVVDPYELTGLGPGAVVNVNQAGEDRAPGGLTWVFQTVAALGVVIGLILVLRAIFTKAMGNRAVVTRSSAVEVLGRVAVAPRHHVLIVRLGGRILVLGESAGGLNTLANLDDAEEVAELLQAVTSSSPGSSGHGFSQLLKRFNGQYTEQNRAEEEGADEHEFQVDRTRDRVNSLMGRLRALGGKGGAA